MTRSILEPWNSRPSGARMAILVLLIAAGFIAACGNRQAQQPSYGTEEPGDVIKLPPVWTPTSVINPEESPVVTDLELWDACPGAPLSQIRAGIIAMVASDIDLTVQVRDIAGWQGSQVVGMLQPGEMVQIIEGPVCWDQLVWWRVRSVLNDTSGWTVEGNEFSNWLIPAP